MRQYKARRCTRQRIWQAMRIMRRFSVADLCRVVEGASVANVQSYISRLFKENYVKKIGEIKRGYVGQFQVYQLVNDIGPTMPVFLKGRHEKKLTGKETGQPEDKQQVTELGEQEVTP